MKKIISTFVIILFIAALGTAGYFYYQLSLLKKNPEAVAQEEAEDLVSIVGKLIILPKGEVPTIATVSDPEKLKDQPFFAKAKVGDKVLLYVKAGKAYLYDPEENKILEVAPINVESSAALEASTGDSTDVESEEAN